MDILSKSFSDAIQRKKWGWLLGLSGVVTYLAYIQQQFNTEWWKTILYFIGAVLSLAVLFFLWFLMINAAKAWKEYRVESIWGETIKDLALAYAKIHQLERNASSVSERKRSF